MGRSAVSSPEGRCQVNVLLLGAGGGGGNILRSLKALFRRDLSIAEKADPKFADRLRRAVSTRFLDTNEFSLLDVLPEERVLIGPSVTGRFGSRHDPQVARAALEESRGDVERLVAGYAVVIIIATGGKGTGAGTVFPLAEMVRRQKKLVIPIFVRPSFEHHEVEKPRYDHALRITDQFDAAHIRLVEILNERGYVESDPRPQSIVWERMNTPIARSLRSFLYVLSDLSQVDPSDLSTLFAGAGRLRIGFAEIEPDETGEPTDAQVDAAARACWDESYYAFRGPVGTSLVCIQGDWSNIVDAKIKSRIATLANGERGTEPRYNPLHARADGTPRPWCISAIFAEHTGPSAALEFDWPLTMRTARAARRAIVLDTHESTPVAAGSSVPAGAPETPAATPSAPRHATPQATRRFNTLWEFAVALNRQDPAALAAARDGADEQIPLDGVEVRRLLAAIWFRTVFPHFSATWRDRLFSVLVDEVVIPNHPVKSGHRVKSLRDLTYAEMKEIWSNTFVPEAIRPDLELLLIVGRLWGDEAIGRLRFADESDGSSRLGALIHGLRT
jgi:cell division GTPase FtsZ